MTGWEPPESRHKVIPTQGSLSVGPGRPVDLPRGPRHDLSSDRA